VVGFAELAFEPEQMLADADAITVHERRLSAQGNVGPVGRIEVLDVKAPSSWIAPNRCVTARQERVGGEHEVTGLTAKDRLVSIDVIHVADEACRRALVEASQTRHGFAPEHTCPVQADGAELALLLAHELKL
jgi:hypothetical protein